MVVGFLVVTGFRVSSTSLIVVVTMSTLSVTKLVVVTFLGGNLVTVGVLTVAATVDANGLEAGLEGVLIMIGLVALR